MIGRIIGILIPPRHMAIGQLTKIVEEENKRNWLKMGGKPWAKIEPIRRTWMWCPHCKCFENIAYVYFLGSPQPLQTEPQLVYYGWIYLRPGCGFPSDVYSEVYGN